MNLRKILWYAYLYLFTRSLTSWLKSKWFLYIQLVLHDVRCVSRVSSVQCILKSTRRRPYTYSYPRWTYIYFYLAVFELVLPNLLVVFVFSVIYTWQRLWHFLHVSVFVAACQSWLVSSSIYQVYNYLCLSLSGTHWLCRLGGFHAFVIVKFPTTFPTRLFHFIAIQAMHKLRSQLYCVQFYANLGTWSQFPYSSYIGASIRFLYVLTICPYLYPNHVVRIAFEFFGFARLPLCVLHFRILSSFSFCISSWTSINILLSQSSLSSLISCASFHLDPVSDLGVASTHDAMTSDYQSMTRSWTNTCCQCRR